MGSSDCKSSAVVSQTSANVWSSLPLNEGQWSFLHDLSNCLPPFLHCQIDPQIEKFTVMLPVFHNSEELS